MTLLNKTTEAADSPRILEHGDLNWILKKISKEKKNSIQKTAYQIYTARLRRAELSIGAFDHDKTMTYLYGPYFNRFGRYIQSLQLNCLTKLLDNNWSIRCIERCIDLKTLAIIGNGYIIQLNAIFASVNLTLQNLTLKDFLSIDRYLLGFSVI